MEEKQTNTNKLSTVQQQVLNILEVCVEIMERHHIHYFMQGGTMLGAVRHGGYIPWDDDVDLGLPRKDYDRFLAIVEKELPPEMKLRTYWDESDHRYYFSRVVDTRYHVKRTGSAEERVEEVWLDLFPLDGMPRSPFGRNVHKVRLMHARLRYSLANVRRLNVKRPDRKLIEKIIIRAALLTGIGSKRDVKTCLDEIDTLLRKYPIEKSNWIINFMGQTTYQFTELLPKSVYGKGKKYRFEHLMLEGPEQYDTYLKKLYGDYMTPPAEADQNAHAIESVDEEQEA
ncbi:MAG: LicD family protein [Lachnospiraceae bacterium]|nr:LicD family protein [Lachnospiraceae bacterium]